MGDSYVFAIKHHELLKVHFKGFLFYHKDFLLHLILCQDDKT